MDVQRQEPEEPANGRLAALFRAEYGALLAGLIRRAGGDFVRAEEALAEAFAAAAEQWPQAGEPQAPVEWLARVAARRLADGARRRVRTTDAEHELGRRARQAAEAACVDDTCSGAPVDDDRLRLMFTCCHPALAREAQVALVLNTLRGLRAAQIARALVVREVTLAQRLVRAKQRIRASGIPFRVPPVEQLGERLETVLAVLYLTFNEGHTATDGDSLMRPDLAGEALDLVRLAVELLPGEGEPRGLLALMLLTHARRAARVDLEGDLVLLPDQDRSLWDAAQIAEGLELVRTTLGRGPTGPYQVQAAIAALHAEAECPAAVDWPQILALYDVLCSVQPSPVAALNRVVALAEVSGPAAALTELEHIAANGRLDDYLYLHATRADLLRRLGDTDSARSAYAHALELADNATERRFLSARLTSL